MRLPATDVADEQAGDGGGGELGHQVGDELVRRHAPAQQDGGADGRIEVAAGDVATGEDHHHQDRSNRERRQRPGARLVGRHTDREHEQEHPDELNCQLPLELETHASPFFGNHARFATTFHSSRRRGNDLPHSLRRRALRGRSRRDEVPRRREPGLRVDRNLDSSEPFHTGRTVK